MSLPPKCSPHPTLLIPTHPDSSRVNQTELIRGYSTLHPAGVHAITDWIFSTNRASYCGMQLIRDIYAAKRAAGKTEKGVETEKGVVETEKGVVETEKGVVETEKGVGSWY